MQIQPTGLDVDQDVDIVPVDALGDAVAQVNVEPATARVTIPVFSDRQSRTLHDQPARHRRPGAGFAVASATVEPHVVTVEGDANELEPLVSIDTEPVWITGLS